MFFCILFFVIHGVEFSLSGRSKTIINSVFYSITILISTIIILINCDFEINISNYSNCMLIRDNYSYYLELILLSISIVIISSTYYYNIDLGLFSFEFYIIMLTCIFSFCLFLHVNHMILLYILVELQSICCYILTSYNKKSRASIEAGLKYFILGSFSSIIMLFGFSLMYGFTGLSFFDDIAIFNKFIYSVENDSLIFMFFFSIICFLIGFLFKIYAAPFHF